MRGIPEVGDIKWRRPNRVLSVGGIRAGKVLEWDMKLTRGRKAAMIGFGIFLAFMEVCTIAARGIYRSGLAQVTAQAPYGSSLVHEVRADGTVKQGQECGIYAESGLRVAAVAVRKGEYFEAEEPLFQIDTDDLQRLIDAKELEIEKLRSQYKEQLLEEDKSEGSVRGRSSVPGRTMRILCGRRMRR